MSDTATAAKVPMDALLFLARLSGLTGSDEEFVGDPQEVLDRVQDFLREREMLRSTYDDHVALLREDIFRQCATISTMQRSVHELSEIISGVSYRLGRVEFIAMEEMGALQSIIASGAPLADHDLCRAERAIRRLQQFKDSSMAPGQ